MKFFFLSLCFFSVAVFSQPLKMKEGLLDLAQKDDLGLTLAKSLETSTVYRARKGQSQYNHGAVLYSFRGCLYAQWQSSRRDEDAEDTRVLYSRSCDGKVWSEASVLVPVRKDAVVTSGGWHAYDDKFVAYINVWPQGLSPKGGVLEAIESKDGQNWSRPVPVVFANGKPVNGVIEQDLHSIGGGRILTALHRQPGIKVFPFYTDDPTGLKGWKIGKIEKFPYKEHISREIEPSNFLRPDGSIVMVFRDQASSFRVLASESKDRGETWSKVQLTNMLDSRAKQSAGNLPNGDVYIVNNPSNSKSREPLVISLSADGRYFDRAYLLRKGGEALKGPKFEGKYKRRGFSYPKSYFWKKHLYVAYAENKEDIKVTRVFLDGLRD